MRIGDYLVRDTLNRGRKFFVYRAKKSGSDGTCIVKALEKQSLFHVKKVPALKAEFDLLRRINSEYVVTPLDWLEDQGMIALVLEDIHGKELSRVLESSPVHVGRFFELADRITAGLSDIHRQGIIHQDICPANIVWNPDTGRLNIIDFDIATQFSTRLSFVNNVEEFRGTLPYISPEQTGRVNRMVDHRTDLYSLGALFYEMLTGAPPFAFSDPNEVIYAHLARDPRPPRRVNREVPVPLSDMVLKLLAKNPEDRYQSVKGLRHDLELLKAVLGSPAGAAPVEPPPMKPASMELGTKDFSGILRIPEKLYGREGEIQQVLDAYQRVSQGAKELLMVAGYSGTGKTSLVNEVHHPITKDRGYFITGKFDPLHRTIPYSAFIQAMSHFCRLILTEKESILAGWRTRILGAVGDLGKILTDLIPALELVIGTQPGVPAVNGEEAEKRFIYVFQRFFRMISSKACPLVLFIDDLQWADQGSLKLLRHLMEDRLSQYVLVIGAYRDNEVSAAHPLTTTLEAIAQNHCGKVVSIPVENLCGAHVREWLQAALKAPFAGEIRDLADLIYEKTHGNAFFTTQFLENLYKEKLLWFDFEQSAWVYEVSEIQGLNISDNVVDLLTQRIRTLPDHVQEHLTLAACIGNVFDLHTLSVVSGTAEMDDNAFLETAFGERLIYPLEGDRYKFVHDRIQQAAYSLTPDEARKPLHLKIARLLLKSFDVIEESGRGEDPEQRIFTIANHYNIGIELVSDPAEALKLSDINLLAGKHARKSGAYTFSLEYIRNAIRLLPPGCWERLYDRALAVYNEAVRISYLCHNFEDMEGVVDTILENCRSMRDAGVAYEFLMNSHISRNQAQAALDILVAVFAKLGVAIPEPSGLEVQTAGMMQQVEKILSNKGEEGLKTLPVMDDDENALALRLFVTGMSAMIYAGPHLLPLVTLKMMELSLNYGFTPDTPFVFVTYGMVRSSLGDTSGAYETGVMTLGLLERMPRDSANTPKIQYMINSYLLGWKTHFKEIAGRHRENYLHAINVGDHEYAGYSLTNESYFLSRTDTDLAVQEEILSTNREKITQIEQTISLLFSSVEIEAVSTLAGNRGNPAVLETEPVRGMPEGISHIHAYTVANRKIYLAYLFDDYENMADYLAQAEQAWPSIPVPLVFWKVDTFFYLPLAYAQLYTRTTDKDQREARLQKVDEAIAAMKQWADFGPMNFAQKYHILRAERFRITGEPGRAGREYDTAVEKAHENDYINEAAIANELAAKMYLVEGREKLAGFYFREALHCWEACGINSKVQYLENRYPKFLNPGMAPQDRF